jgi:aspartate kinase
MSEKTLVMKFGGTSVGSPEAMTQAAEIVKTARADWPRVAAVTSAISGATNLLLDTAAKAVKGDQAAIYAAANELRARHAVIADALIPGRVQREQVKTEINRLVDEFTNLCMAISVLGESTPRALDAVAGLGERMAIRLLAAVIVTLGVPAVPVESTRLIVTDDRFQDAVPDLDATTRKTRAELEPLLSAGQVPIVTGFLGATPSGVTTTLGRGGSDYSAAILGAALSADDVWIWTDVDGVMSADPRVVPDAVTIPVLTFREVGELAYFGAKVLHPKTIRPVIEAGIGLRVCNTFNPSHPGTRLVADRNGEGSGVVKAVTAIRKQKLITIEGRGMLGVPGVAARTFGAVAATGTSVPLITQASSEQSICFAVPSEAAEMVVRRMESAFAAELARRDIDRVWAGDETVIITVVGVGMRNTPGIAGRIFTVLGEQKVNVIAIAQGSSEVSISLVVDAADAERGVKAIHELIQAEGAR